MMPFRVALALVCVTAAVATDFVWNGPGSSFNSPAAWDGPAPQNDDGKIPDYVQFGSDQKGKKVVANIPASDDPYNVGMKIVFNGAGKLVLGDGSSRSKTTLSFEKGSDGVSTFLPGSGLSTKDDDETAAKLAPFDMNCHRNWVIKGEEDKVPLLPPCDDDRAYFVSDASEDNFDQPSNIKEGDQFWASSYKKKFTAKIYVQDNTDERARSKDADDCTKEGLLVSNVGVLDVARCGPDTTFGEKNTGKCVTTCPPYTKLDDGSYIQSDGTTDKDGNKVYKRISPDGEVTKDEVAVADDEITVATGEVTHTYVKDGKAGHKKVETTTVTTTTTTTTEEAKGSVDKNKNKDTGSDTAGNDGESTTKKPKPDDGGDDDDDDDDGNADSGASSQNDKKDSGSTIIIVVVVVVIILIGVVFGAIFFVKSQQGGRAGGNVVSFENPMYDNQAGVNKQNPVAGGYAEPQGQANAGLYSEPFDPNQQGGAASGYMDVSPSHQPAGGNASGGYMDVAPGAAQPMDDDDGEDV